MSQLREHIRTALKMPGGIVETYLKDLTDAEICADVIHGVNPIAWQLGHLVASEHWLVSQVSKSPLEPLPAGFAERHAQKPEALAQRDGFLTKDEYLALLRKQRSVTLAVLEQFSDDELMAETPEKIRMFAATVGTLLQSQGTHAVMHAGQWAAVRRVLGKPVAI